METRRLVFRRLQADDLEAFHALVVDPHIKRYLLDGATMPLEWTHAEIERSERLFENAALGLWLVWEQGGRGPIGFAGYRVFEELDPAPQLLYAFRESATGKGYATETATALVAHAEAAGLTEIVAGVDEPNRASVRVLEKLGFERTRSMPGTFGEVWMFRRTAR